MSWRGLVLAASLVAIASPGSAAQPAPGGDGAEPSTTAPSAGPGAPATPAAPAPAEPAEPEPAPAASTSSGLDPVGQCKKPDKMKAAPDKPKAASGLMQDDLKTQAERLHFEKAVERYVATSYDYRREVNQILLASIDERKGLLNKQFDKLLADQDLGERENREDAIAMFEAFLRKYPNHDKYTPDAMFRLAELYYERSAIDYEDARVAYDKQRALYDRGKVPEEPVSPERNYADVIRVYNDLLSRFGDSYRYADAVYYLLGYVQNEAGGDVQARDAWESLVSKFPKSKYAPEVVLRIGEILFDYGEFTKAAEQYKRAMAYPDSSYYDKALYKLAWTYFQMYDYDSAIKTFVDLIAWYDVNAKNSGLTGSALREEAIEYLAKSLAEDDWDNDGLRDENAGVDRALAYLSTGANHETDIIAAYAESLYNLHDRDKYTEAVRVYRELINRQPLAVGAASWQRQVIKIFDVLRDVDRATEERRKLAQMFAPNSAWAKANANNPKALREASEAAEVAMRERALWHHQRAQELKAQAAIEGEAPNPELLAQSLSHYAKAAAAYQAYLDSYPNEPLSYEMRFNLAETYYYSEQFERAAEVYMEVARIQHHDSFREPAAWSAIKAQERIISDMVAKGGLEAKADPNAEWTPPEEPEDDKKKDGDEKASTEVKRVVAQAMPAQLKTWIDAVDFYKRYGLVREEDPEATATIAYQAGEMAFRYKHYEDARERFRQVLACHPRSDVAANAIANIINSYRDENDWPNLEKWADLADQLDLGSEEFKTSIRAQIKTFKLGAQFQHAEALLAEKNHLPAAREFERLADQNQDATFADKAYFNAAMSYKEVKYYDSASRIFEKLVTDPRYKKSAFAEESLFELAENYKLFFNFEKGVGAYMALYNRYPNGKNRAYALFQSARLQEMNGDYAQAARTYEDYARVFPRRDDAAVSFYRAATLHKRMKNEREEERVLEAFIERFANTPGQSERIIEAKLRLGDLAAERRRTKKAKRFYDEVIREYAARGMKPGTNAAEAAAKATYLLVEERFEAYKRVKLKGTQKRQKAAIEKKKKLLTELQDAYAGVFQYKAVDWTICSYYRLGDLYRVFAQMLYSAPEPTGLSADELDVFITLIEDQGLKFENVAIERFETTVEQSRRLKVTNKCARQALEAINKYQPDKYPLFKEELQRTTVEPVFRIDPSLPGTVEAR